MAPRSTTATMRCCCNKEHHRALRRNSTVVSTSSYTGVSINFTRKCTSVKYCSPASKFRIFRGPSSFHQSQYNNLQKYTSKKINLHQPALVATRSSTTKCYHELAATSHSNCRRSLTTGAASQTAGVGLTTFTTRNQPKTSFTAITGKMSQSFVKTKNVP